MWSIPDAVILAIGWWVRDIRDVQGCPPAPAVQKVQVQTMWGVPRYLNIYPFGYQKPALWTRSEPHKREFLEYLRTASGGLGVPGKFGYFGYTEKKHSAPISLNAFP